MRIYMPFRIFNTITILLLFITTSFAKPSIKIDEYHIYRDGDKYMIKGKVTGSGLLQPIPVYDHVYITIEVPTSPNPQYPKFEEYFNHAKGCLGAGKRCLSKEELEGVGVKSFRVADFYLRKTPVWVEYGGIGEWEHNAPERVTHFFQAEIPKEAYGKRVRLHAKLQYVIGGPNAYWEGISYYHDTKMITISNEKSKKDSHEEQELQKRYQRCKQYIQWIKKHIEKLKEEKRKADEAIESTYFNLSSTQVIIDDIQQMHQLQKIGSNPKLVIQELLPEKKSQSLAEYIRLEESALNDREKECQNYLQKLNQLRKKQ